MKETDSKVQVSPKIINYVIKLQISWFYVTPGFVCAFLFESCNDVFGCTVGITD